MGDVPTLTIWDEMKWRWLRFDVPPPVAQTGLKLHMVVDESDMIACIKFIMNKSKDQAEWKSQRGKNDTNSNNPPSSN